MKLDVLSRMAEKFKDAPGTGEFATKDAQILKPDVDMQNRLVKGKVSVAVPDMDGEIVLPSGIDTSYFRKVGSVYYGHNYEELPVGMCVNLSVKDGGRTMWAVTQISPGGFGDDLLSAMSVGAVRGFSIGMKVTDAGPPSTEETKAYGMCDTMIRKALMVEYSITAMPACPDALVDMKSKGLIRQSSVERFMEWDIALPDKFDVSEMIKQPRRVVVVDGACYMR